MLRRSRSTLPWARVLVVLCAVLAGCGHGGSSLPAVPGTVGAAAVARAAATTSGSVTLCPNIAPATPAPPSTYRALVLADAPTAYYPLDDTTAVLTDAANGSVTVNGSYGSAVSRGAKGVTTGAVGAAGFPGGNAYNPQGYAFTPRSHALEFPCPTVEAWFSLNAPNATSHDLPIVVYGDIGRGARYGIFVHGLGGGQQALMTQLRGIGKPAFSILSHTRLAVGRVYHVVAAYDGANLAVYINGQLDETATYLADIDYSPYFANGLQIGGGNQAPSWGSASFPGTIGQVALYPIPLAATQVENHELAGRIVSELTETPVDADTFVDSFGINTHFEVPESTYSTQFATVKNLLVASGIRHVRSSVNYTDTALPGEMQQLAAAGIRADYITIGTMTQAQVQAWPGIVGASFESYEPPNEQDDVGNPNWLPEAIAFQQNLYSWVKSDPAIARYPVLGPTVVGMQDAELLGNLSAYMDLGNLHDYFSVFNPGTPGWGNIHPPFGIYGSISFNTNIARVIDGSKPLESTETGYGTIAGNPLALDYRTHLRYMTRLFFEQFNNGIVRTYSYEFIDKGGTALFDNFGLLTTTLQPKPAYTGIKSLIAALSDRGAPFPTTPLTFEISGATDIVHHTLMQRRNGHVVLAVWIEEPGWVGQNSVGGDIIVPPENVTLTTARRFSSATISTMDENGNLSTAPLNGWTGTGAAVTIGDKVSLIELTP